MTAALASGPTTGQVDPIRAELEALTGRLTAGGPLTVTGWQELVSQIPPHLRGRLVDAIQAARTEGFFAGAVAEANAAGAVTEHGSVYLDRQVAALHPPLPGMPS